MVRGSLSELILVGQMDKCHCPVLIELNIQKSNQVTFTIQIPKLLNLIFKLDHSFVVRFYKLFFKLNLTFNKTMHLIQNKII